MRTRVKICCIASQDEARLAIAAGADALGLVAEMPSGPGPIPDELAAEIAAIIPPPVTPFLLTSREDGAAIAGHALAVGVQCVQVVRHVDPREHLQIIRADRRLKIIQVVHVEDEGAIGIAAEYAETADALLLDSGRPSLPVAELGGTGRAHDWSVSRRIVEAVDIPVFLAGGLNPGNVAEAIRQVRPFGVDICSGLRTNGDLDAAKVEPFVRAVAGA